MSEHIEDVVIIGGGPAGSTMATLLARKGYSVTIFEKEKFPRPHIGESLLPFCYWLFKDLGVVEEMEKYFVRKPGVQFISPDGKDINTYCFKYVLKDDSYLSFHVIRAKFDDVLLRNSEKHGAKVFEEHKVVDVILDRPDGLAEIHVLDKAGNEKRVLARQMVDASGQMTFMAKKLKSKKSYDILPRLALATHWMVDKMPKHLEEGILQVVYTGGEQMGWIWVTPVGVHRLGIGIVLNDAYVKKEKEKILAKGIKSWEQELYTQELFASDHLKHVLKDATQADQPLMINGDYSNYSAIKYGDNFAISGDASAFLDPVFASGVYLAMKSSELIAKELDKKLSTGNISDNSGLEAAYEHINGAIGLVGKFINYFYHPESFSLAEMKGGHFEGHADHHAIYSLLHFLLAGDFFTEYRRYDAFMELLKDPKQFARYKHLRIEAQDHSVDTCEMDVEKVFSEFMKEQAKISA